MQCADDVVAIEDAKLGQVGAAVWTFALHDEVADHNLVRKMILSSGTPTRLVFCSSNSFDRQALEEVVQIFVELSVTPGSEPTTQEERVRPIDALVPNNQLK